MAQWDLAHPGESHIAYTPHFDFLTSPFRLHFGILPLFSTHLCSVLFNSSSFEELAYIHARPRGVLLSYWDTTHKEDDRTARA